MPEIYYSNYEIKNDTCLSVTDALYLISTKSYDEINEGVAVPQLMMNAYPNDYFNDATRITYKASNYLMVASKTISDSEYAKALQDYILKHMDLPLID